MKIRTSDLAGTALDWAVAILEFPPGNYEGAADHYSGNNNKRWVRIPDKAKRTWVLAKYSTDWSQVGPIIEREGIRWNKDNEVFYAWTPDHDWIDPLHEPMISDDPGVQWRGFEYGPTLLIAAMRCYVASKLGDEVEVPGEFE